MKNNKSTIELNVFSCKRAKHYRIYIYDYDEQDFRTTYISQNRQDQFDFLPDVFVLDVENVQSGD